MLSIETLNNEDDEEDFDTKLDNCEVTNIKTLELNRVEVFGFQFGAIVIDIRIS